MTPGTPETPGDGGMEEGGESMPMGEPENRLEDGEEEGGSDM